MAVGAASDREVRDALAAATAALPRGEDRPGQVEMAVAVARSIAEHRPLIVQAGTGTGKSLAYLVPAVVSGAKVIVATATKALQDQLADKDLPFLAEHVDHPFTFAVLKGRSNYVCRQRVHEATTSDAQLTLEGTTDRSLAEQVRRIADWAATSPTGDRAELDHEPSPRAWAAVSVGPRECPGAANCPRGHELLRRAGPGRSRRGRRRRGQHPSLQPERRGRWGAAARTRRRGHRRGPPVRGRRVEHLRARAHRRAADQPGPGHPGDRRGPGHHRPPRGRQHAPHLRVGRARRPAAAGPDGRRPRRRTDRHPRARRGPARHPARPARRRARRRRRPQAARPQDGGHAPRRHRLDPGRAAQPRGVDRGHTGRARAPRRARSTWPRRCASRCGRPRPWC